MNFWRYYSELKIVGLFKREVTPNDPKIQILETCSKDTLAMTKGVEIRMFSAVLFITAKKKWKVT